MASRPSVFYSNNKDEWPEGEWPDEGEPPCGERCQYVSEPSGFPCGLPRYADDKNGESRCIFHYERNRDWRELRVQLEAAVKRGADLRKANLGNAYLWGAKLQNAQLRGANAQNATLTDAHLKDADLCLADLQNAGLWGADLENTKLEYAKLQKARLQTAKLKGDVDLRNANLTDAELWHVEISPQAKLDGVTWWEGEDKRLKCERDVCAGYQPEPMSAAAAFRECEAVYRQIKHSYQQSGDYQTAGQFFVREMECQRRRLILEGRERVKKSEWRAQGWWVRASHWLGYTFDRGFRWLMCATSRYGEEPLRLLFVMVVLVLLFAVVHAAAGFSQVTDKGRVPVFKGLGAPEMGAGHLPLNVFRWRFILGEDFCLAQAMRKAIYFSIVNFTSLGHGDLQPTDAGSVVCSIEVVLGVFLIALFMICVTRRFSR